MKSFIKIYCIIILFTSCEKLFNDDELTLPLKPYLGDELRIDGYYYLIGLNGKINSVHIFYANGILLVPDGAEGSFDDMDKYIHKYFMKSKSYKRTRYDWGLFLIENDSIAFERWYPSERPHKAYVRAGNIQNDTTFHITESYRMQNGKKTEVRERNEIYYFRQFNPKPDSTNKFIK